MTVTMSNWGKIRLRQISDSFIQTSEINLLERVIQDVFGINELTVEGAEQDQGRYL